MAFTSYEVDNDRRFNRAVKRAAKEVGDLRIPLTLISKDFYKSNKAIWGLKGPGQYPDLADSTKERKQRAGVPIYPILQFSGQLRGSMERPSHPNAINQIINRKSLVLGTSLFYGVFHQSDRPRSIIPLRKFLFIGPESAKNVPKGANIDSKGRGRLQRWTSIIEGHVVAVAAKRLGSGK